MEFVKINGSFGEGGGQIVRTSLTLSCITNKPITIENIRKNRKNPGLKPQHLTAIKILKKICDAKTEGDVIGSTSFSFIPNKISDSKIDENVGTAGSIALILQTVIPVSALCGTKLNLSIIGGTDVMWSPTMTYTKHVLKEAYARFGINFSLNITKRGYYPRGGGIVNLKVYPSRIRAVSLVERKTKEMKLFCSFSKMPKGVIEEKIERIKSKLVEKKFNVHSIIENDEAIDSGASLLICSIDENSIIGIDSIYDKKKNEFPLDLNKITENNLGVDENLVDMLVLPASLSSDTSKFRVSTISKHLETNLFVASEITGCKYGIGKLSNGYEIRVKGVSDSSVQ